MTCAMARRQTKTNWRNLTFLVIVLVLVLLAMSDCEHELTPLGVTGSVVTYFMVGGM